MKVLGEESVDGRECLVCELPYSQNKVWLLKRIKGKDMKQIRNVMNAEDIVNILVKKTDPVVEGSLYDELDLTDINAINRHYEPLLNELEELIDVKKK